MSIVISPPKLQIDFAYKLKKFRSTYLQNALLETVRTMDIAELDRQLAKYVLPADLATLATYGLRAELVFAVPAVLEANPYLLGYYRLLMGYSQKEFYGQDKGFGVGPFKSMEERGQIRAIVAAKIPELCAALSEAASVLLTGVGPLKISRELLDDLTLLTVGPQLRGGANNKLGSAGIVEVFGVIQEIVAHASPSVSETTIEVRNAAGRSVLIQFAPDPDIIIREAMSAKAYRAVVAIEVKSGTDVSNIHNRLGEAEKSHQKAKSEGFTECWTVVNARVDPAKAKMQSPSTNRFYSLAALLLREGDEYEDFRLRILSLTSIPSPT